MWPVIVAIVGVALTAGGILWRFSSVTTSLQVTLVHLGDAINDLKSQIAQLARHGETLAAHEARIKNLEDRSDRLEDKL